MRHKKLSVILTYDGSGKTIFLLALAAGVDFDFSIAIKYETSAKTASKSAILATLVLFCNLFW